MLKRITTCALVMMIIVTACQKKNVVRTLTVKNSLDIDRPASTVSIPLDTLQELVTKYGADHLVIKDQDKLLVTQLVDTEGDGIPNELLFQTDIKAGEEKDFTIEAVKDVAASAPEHTTYSRFVPERIDDYAWENDRVAFRTYGPKAQQITESGKPGGTLTSGMDCWFKRVAYPVIDKWYKKNLDTAGYYHIDHGEGYDPYHVGNSRGCGGIGIWESDSLYVSKNFISCKTIASGPIRTIFELTYAPWSANGATVNEKKIISLDLGSNLSRHEVHIQSNKPLPNITTGITLHDQKGEAKLDSVTGWIRYWEPIDDSELGTGIVVAPQQVIALKEYRTKTKDQSHVLIVAKPEDVVVYYAGFGWKKSGQYTSVADWDQYLTNFSKQIASPLTIHIK
ncbi:DUF4861 domain-containing protein [Ohtaekwangia kribbensis]|uniref:DUF4861 domain-containing protein n=1 Tax=Ohtaekwangia kribbensis TaxID=688913 RepID=A0ABW3KEI5_9BACT